MDRVKLNPLGKTYYFNEYCCYKCKTGICSLDKLTLDDIRNLQKVNKLCIRENSEEYCTDLARKILLYDYSPKVLLNLNSQCGHYSLSDGQHRTCIIARICQKGGEVKYEPYFSTQTGQCLHCLNKEHYLKLENSLNFLINYLEQKNINKL